MLHEPAEHIVPLGHPQFLVPDRPNGAGCVLLHGFSGSPYQMRDLGELLRSRGYTVSIPRLPGHASRVSYLARVHRQEWEACVDEAIRNLRAHCTPVFIIGRSFGGVLGILASLHHQESVRACIGIGTPAPLFQARFTRRALPLLRLFRSSIRKPWAKPEENTARLAQGRYLELPLAALAQYFTVLCTLTPSLLRRVTVPILFVQGRNDTAVNPQSMEYYLAHVGSTDKESLWVEMATHDAEKLHGHPEVQRRVLDFLERHRT